MSETVTAKDLVLKLQSIGRTVSIMESCTGGGMANQITNIDGASRIFNFCAVTYSNEYKIKMGVDANIIEKYGVYSIQTAREMGLKISEFTGSDYGIGITGKLNCSDISNQGGPDDIVYISIYDKNANIFKDDCIKVKSNIREKNKEKVILKVIGNVYNLA